MRGVRGRALVFAVAWLAMTRTALACQPIWLPTSVPPGTGFVIATLGSAGVGEGVRAEVERAGGAAAPDARGSIVLVPWSLRGRAAGK